jgi:hypothetical protein
MRPVPGVLTSKERTGDNRRGSPADALAVGLQEVDPQVIGWIEVGEPMVDRAPARRI